jgi:hypothetical protein
MPFTPFHFGPGACVSLPLNRHLDLPVFLLANVALDVEPLLVMTLDLSYPLHGCAHTLIGGAVVGAALGLISYPFRGVIADGMALLCIPYIPSRARMLLSGVLGAWFHILLDAPLYTDIRPFRPLAKNPLFGLVSSDMLYTACAYLFIPAALFYLMIVLVRNRRRTTKDD